MFRVCMLFSVVVLTRAQIPSLGFCPDYLPMPDFEIESFLGKWYETERYFQFTEITSRCVITDYAKGPSGKIYVSNEVTNSFTGVKRIIDGLLHLSGRTGEGKFNIKYSTTPLSSQAQLMVLETDYDNYAVLWSCSGFGPIHTQSVWAMTRERLAPGPVLQKIYGILDKFRISRNFFVKTDQEGCALAASDINAANGISPISTVAEATGSSQRKTLTSNTRKGESVKSAVDGSEPVKAVDGDLETIKSIDVTVKSREDYIPEPFVPIAFAPEEVLPQKVVLDAVMPQTVITEAFVPKVVIPETLNSEVIRNAPFVSNPIKVDIIDTPVAGVAVGVIRDAVNAVVSNSDVTFQPEVVKILPQKELKPVQVAKVILENNPIQPVEVNNNILRAPIVPIIEPLTFIASKHVPVSEIVKVVEETAPLKTEILLEEETN